MKIKHLTLFILTLSALLMINIIYDSMYMNNIYTMGKKKINDDVMSDSYGNGWRKRCNGRLD